MARYPVFTPEYEAELRRMYADDWNYAALIGGLRAAMLFDDDGAALARCRAMLAIWDEVQAEQRTPDMNERQSNGNL